MSSLQDVWNWYQQTRLVLKLARRLGNKHWDNLPSESSTALDDEFKAVQGTDLAQWATMGLEHLDEMAIVRLFAAFESLVRQRVVDGIEVERETLSHPALVFAADEVLGDVRRGSFARVLLALKRVDPDLVEQVRQVRQYRNWVSHRKDPARAKVPSVDPKGSYERLRRFHEALDERAPGRPQDGRSTR